MTLQATVLDPVRIANGSVALGFTELAAIYDNVVRWNEETQEYEPRTGEFHPNDDYTVWTLSIKPGIEFQDGTPYDAAAVMQHVERFMGPEATGGAKFMLLAMVKGMRLVDPLTLEFTLTQPWSGFPVLFTKEVGWIPSPSQVEARGDDFAINPGPAGAGPFELASYRPGEELVLKRNDTYYGDPTPLDTVTFRAIGGGDPALQFEGLLNGEVDVVYTSDTTLLRSVEESGEDVYLAGGLVDSPAGGLDLMNSSTIPLEVRRATQMAINPEVISQRVYDGLLPGSSALFHNDFRYHPGTEGLPYDLPKARQLFEEARQGGWSGRIRVLGASTSAEQADLVQVVVAMLKEAGVDAVPELVEFADFAERVSARKDFDVAVGYSLVFSTNPDEYFAQLYKNFNSEAPRWGYSSPDMDDALRLLAVADSDADWVEGFERLQGVWNRDVPAVIHSSTISGYVADNRVQGLELSTSGGGLLDTVWMRP